MAWIIDFTPKAKKILFKMNWGERDRILEFLENRVAHHPDPSDLAEPLSGNFKGYHRFRCGDHRVICTIQKEVVTILVVHVGHRREVYNIIH